MYNIYLVLTLLLLPLCATLFEHRRYDTLWKAAFCRWALFFILGMRLSTAGISQLLRPGYTAALLSIGAEATVVIRELGLMNLAVGLLCCAAAFKSPLRPWVSATALLFTGGAAIGHLLQSSGPLTSQVAATTITDAYMAIAALGCLLFSLSMAPVRYGKRTTAPKHK